MPPVARAAFLPTIAAALVAVGGTGSPAAAEPFSFRGITLGASLPEVRRMRFPEAPGARILCSHDPEARGIRPTRDFIAADSADVEAGITVCLAFTFGKALGHSSAQLPPEWWPARLKVGSIEVSPAFWFAPEAKAEDETRWRLYRIVMRSNNAFWDETRAAFVRRYGQPATVERGSTASWRWSLLDNETATWANAESTIRLFKRFETPNRMTILYEHTALTPAVPSAFGPGGASPPALQREGPGEKTPRPADPG